MVMVSPSSRRAWIEMPLLAAWRFRAASSPSSRRAWIEMLVLGTTVATFSVALLAEGVDRNGSEKSGCALPSVALLAEGVDRNV